MSVTRNGLKITLFSLIMISIVCSVFTFAELNPSTMDMLVSAQISESSPIQVMSTSTYTDDLGNFHIIGEVNNRLKTIHFQGKY